MCIYINIYEYAPTIISSDRPNHHCYSVYFASSANDYARCVGGPNSWAKERVAVGIGQTRVISSGTKINIWCELKSATMPPSAISWERVYCGHREPISDDSSKIIIMRTDGESELLTSSFGNTGVGTYQCISENLVGSDVASVRLDLCPPEALPCPVGADPSFFNVSVQVTEGLNDTCVYCATWQVTLFGPVSWLVTTSGVVFKESEFTLVMNVPVATSVSIPQSLY